MGPTMKDGTMKGVPAMNTSIINALNAIAIREKEKSDRLDAQRDEAWDKAQYCGMDYDLQERACSQHGLVYLSKEIAKDAAGGMPEKDLLESIDGQLSTAQRIVRNYDDDDTYMMDEQYARIRLLSEIRDAIANPPTVEEPEDGETGVDYVTLYFFDADGCDVDPCDMAITTAEDADEAPKAAAADLEPTFVELRIKAGTYYGLDDDAHLSAGKQADGSWKISGKTYPARNALRAIGCEFDKRLKKWFAPSFEALSRYVVDMAVNAIPLADARF